ncbi:N-acetylmuramoyl-L-alanine amidase [Planococcus halocryophilus]|uniref:N-acetylmuramoyl-L-alanine amidase n=1 Tax=Planococcus halocryophilus TaxID=1215089 RepID=UPI00034BDEDC|nr:N-acetylmuramoyl-L-alanine amidase [Planococcus halocryophilus]
MKILIDAGHGPNTPGKRSPDGKLREFYFNSAVAEEVKKQLSLDGHLVFSVIRMILTFPCTNEHSLPIA